MIVGSFIDSVRQLEIIESSLILLKHYSENTNSHDDLDSLDQAYKIIATNNKELIATIRKYLSVNQGDLISKNLSPTNISLNINSAIKIIINIKEGSIPGKSEMIEILRKCADDLSEQQFIKVFSTLSSDSKNFRQQILTLGDLCEKE